MESEKEKEPDSDESECENQNDNQFDSSSNEENAPGTSTASDPADGNEGAKLEVNNSLDGGEIGAAGESAPYVSMKKWWKDEQHELEKLQNSLLTGEYGPIAGPSSAGSSGSGKPARPTTLADAYKLVVGFHNIMQHFEALNAQRLETILRQRSLIAELRVKLQQFRLTKETSSVVTPQQAQGGENKKEGEEYFVVCNLDPPKVSTYPADSSSSSVHGEAGSTTDMASDLETDTENDDDKKEAAANAEQSDSDDEEDKYNTNAEVAKIEKEFTF